MIMKAAINNRELLDILAENPNDHDIRSMNKKRIMSQSSLAGSDIQLIDDFIFTVKKMAVEDSDNAHQSLWLRYLEEKFSEIRARLLARMNGVII